MLDLGGAGSGNFGHEGRPGEIGGSGAGSAARGRPESPNAAATRVANSYNAAHDLPPIDHGYVKVDEVRAGDIADAYDALPADDRDNPKVKAAYAALAREVSDQWDHITESGMTFEPWTKDGQPYQSSTEMASDVRDHNHMYFFTGGEPHPLLGEKDPQSGLSINDKFRAVHDYFGHAAGGYGFGPRGEENAWLSHSQMLTPDARRALTTETRGQNSWVNFGDQNYHADGTHKNIPPAERPYATQKVALLPDEYVLMPGETSLGRAHHLRGNANSGNFGHKGRPGSVGGSAPAETAAYYSTPSEAILGLLNKEKVNITKEDVRALLEKATKQFEDPDLTDVHVEGMQIFGGNGLGIARKNMPQIPREHRKSFLKEVRDQGIEVRDELVDPLSLAPTQKEISARNAGDKLREYERRGSDKKFPPLLVAEDNHVLDGHHHWGMMATIAIDNPSVRVPIKRLRTSTAKALEIMRKYDKDHDIATKAIGLLDDPGFDPRPWMRPFGYDLRGNENSGNRGHAGRPGEVGGSAPGGAGSGRVGFRVATADDTVRLRALGVPPAALKDLVANEVELAHDPTADLQATFKDAAGRTQYKYVAGHKAKADAEKFARLKEFNKELPTIRQRVAEDLDNPRLSPEERDSAVVTYLIDKTGFRPGSDKETGGAKKAYGATTLEGRHVQIDGDKVRFRFIGKHGVDISKTLTDPVLAKELTERKSKGGRLFPETSDSKLRDYLHSRDGDFKVKDMRTWNGTNKALEEIGKMRPPKTDKDFRKAQREVAKKVGRHLGNEPTEALKSYIDPAVWGKWRAVSGAKK